VDFDSEEVKKFSGMAGCDMPDKICPKCGAKLRKDGYSINLPDKISDFISEKKLIAFNGEVIMTATIHFIEDPYAYSIPKIIFISNFAILFYYCKC